MMGMEIWIPLSISYNSSNNELSKSTVAMTTRTSGVLGRSSNSSFSGSSEQTHIIMDFKGGMM